MSANVIRFRARKTRRPAFEAAQIDIEDIKKVISVYDSKRNDVWGALQAMNSTPEDMKSRLSARAKVANPGQDLPGALVTHLLDASEYFEAIANMFRDVAARVTMVREDGLSSGTNQGNSKGGSIHNAANTTNAPKRR